MKLELLQLNLFFYDQLYWKCNPLSHFTNVLYIIALIFEFKQIVNTNSDGRSSGFARFKEGTSRQDKEGL